MARWEIMAQSKDVLTDFIFLFLLGTLRRIALVRTTRPAEVHTCV